MFGRRHQGHGHGHGHHGHRHGHGHGHRQPPQQPEQTFKIFCRAYEGYRLTVRHDAVVLAPANPGDEYQHWVKDMRRSTSIRDEEGHGAFALVNRATRKAIQHSHGQGHPGHPVRLVPYNPDNLDESVLWTSKDVRDNLDGNGFRRIRMVNNIYLNFDVDQRRNIVLSNRSTGKFEQHWKIMPRCKHELAPKLCSLITSSLPLAFLMQRA